MLRVTCYGAVEEIGGNKILLEDGDSAIMLDFGKSFGAMGLYFDEFLQPRTNSSLRDLLALGILPQIPGIYRKDLLTHAGAWAAVAGEGLPPSARRLFECEVESCEDYRIKYGKPRVDGILLSHGHTDHCQHLCFVDPSIPVYCSAVTAAILKAAQDIGRGGWESEICSCALRSVQVCSGSSTFPGELKIDVKNGGCRRDVRMVKPHEVFQVGWFSVEPIAVDHSVPGACAYLITAPSGKTVFYTGDVRFHGRFSVGADCITSRLRERTKGLRPDVLITEGTRVGKDGRVTTEGDNELDVEERICEAVGGCSGLAVIDFGWKDTTRFQTVLNVAKATGRVLAVSPKVAYLWELLRADDPYSFPDLAQSENVRVYLKRTESMIYSLADYSGSKHLAGTCLDWGDRSTEMKKRFAAKDFEYMAPRLCHYRDGLRAYDISANPSRYILHAGYYDINELFDVDPPKGSVYVSAITEPFSDEMEFGENRLANWLERFGLIDAGQKIAHYHVSGHANGSDLLRLIVDAQPSAVIPVHTEKENLPVFERELGGKCDVIRPALGAQIEVA
jgi:ribonuclease J